MASVIPVKVNFPYKPLTCISRTLSYQLLILLSNSQVINYAYRLRKNIQKEEQQQTLIVAVRNDTSFSFEGG